MLKENAVSPTYFSNTTAANYSISQAFVAKLGFVRFELTDAYRTRLRTEQGSGSKVLMEYVDELYSLLQKSPHIMEIKPTLKDLGLQEVEWVN